MKLQRILADTTSVSTDVFSSSLKIFSLKKKILYWSCSMESIHRGQFLSYFKLHTDFSCNQQLGSIGNMYWLMKSQIICLVFGLTLNVAPNILAPWTTVLDTRLIYSICIHFSSTATSKHSLINSPLVNGFPCLTNKWATQKPLQPHFHILFLWRNSAVKRSSF